jgi:hypothetical protein
MTELDIAQKLRNKANDLYSNEGEAIKYWDQIRGKVETLKGSDLPRLMFESFIEDIADLLVEGAEALDKK